YMAYTLKFASSTYSLNLFGHPELGYAAVWAVLANLILVVVLSAIFNGAKMSNGVDKTSPSDYQPEVNPARAVETH
ncbi:MAG: sodium:solute symporter, partial [Acidimicrobiaceae bacterium]|nr:sodium:solute symporter [Acidimicrobiaceae bacterium]